MRLLSVIFCLLAFPKAGADPATLERCKTVDKWDHKENNEPENPYGPQMFITIFQSDAEEFVDVVVKQNGETLSQQTYDTSTGTGGTARDDNGKPVDTQTHNGSFKVQYLDRHHRSRQFGKPGPDGVISKDEGAPMYNAIFFNGGEALHGTVASNDKYLGRPASHGCARLKRSQSLELFEAVCAIGPQNVFIDVVGSVNPARSQEATPEYSGKVGLY